MRKTKTEIQIQTYGGFQNSMQRMSREEHDMYSAPGTPERERHEARLREVEKIKQIRAKALKRFMETEPHFGTLGGLPESALADAIKARKDWEESKKAFLADLDKRFPLPETAWSGMSTKGKGGKGRPKGEDYL